MNWMIWIGAGIVLLVLAGLIGEAIAEGLDRRRYPPPGRIVEIGDGRLLHLLCEGQGPTVIVEQGAGEPSVLWRGLQRRAASFAHFCIYDRAGYGWSPAAPTFQSVDERAADLRALLDAAGKPAPYVLVAHSYGGLIARAFAKRYPGDTAGLLMVDAIEESIAFHPDYLKFLRQSKPIVGLLRVAAALGILRLVGRLTRGRDQNPVIERVSEQMAGAMAARPSHFAAIAGDLRSIEDASAHCPLPVGFGEMGTIPVIAITHGQPFPGPFSRLEPFWRAGQERLLSLSSASQLLVAEESNHMVAFEQPELVLAALQQLTLTRAEMVGSSEAVLAVSLSNAAPRGPMT